MYKLVVFDLDKTIADLGKGVSRENIRLMRLIENKCGNVAVCSGKPVYYLCGFMRQVGLKSPVLLGENGAVQQFGVDLPPKKCVFLPYADEAKSAIAYLKKEIEKILPDIWFQPNQVGLTPFPKNSMEFKIIEECLVRNRGILKYLSVCRHSDSFDIMPINLTKYAGVKALGEYLHILPEETIAVGDGANDMPMFEYAGYSVGVNVKNAECVSVNFKTTVKALRHIYEII